LTPQLSEAKFPLAVSVPNPGLQPWEFLNANSGLSRVAWVDRTSNKASVGIGAAATVTAVAGDEVSNCVSRCREILGGSSTLRFFGGFSFDGTDSWEGFGAGRFVLPRLLLSDETLTLAITGPEDLERAKLDLERISFESSPIEFELPPPTTTNYLPTVDGWQSRIDEALSLIRSEVLEKIVLSRKAILRFASALNPIALTSRLQAATHDCFVFCFNFEEDMAFVGATPERLFYRQGDLLQSEVVAGTRTRGENESQDEKLAIELLTSDKDQREHDIVRKSIRQKLHKFIDHLRVDSQASILRLARKQHLRSNVEGTLKPGVDDSMILNRLHPTPAVGGYPTDNALPEIARIEPFNRGWYAAPVGWIGSNSSQFAVAIRSGLVNNDELSLFSGAGIVRGSEPAEEWQEVDCKIQDFVNILGKS
ncbi:MAG: isochorismate synthase, partial [Planctomycetota bacterium]